jgi:GNAT superfamily N-acetyltransferase
MGAPASTNDTARQDVRIRRATVDDLDDLMTWRERVVREVFAAGDADLGDLLAENARYYRDELESGGHIACFASIGDDTVGCGGMCLQREMPSPDNPSGRCAWLMNIYVDPAHRGRGVGEAIVSWLVDTARAHGADKIWLETTSDGRPVYEKLGFADLPDILKLG